MVGIYNQMMVVLLWLIDKQDYNYYALVKIPVYNGDKITMKG